MKSHLPTKDMFVEASKAKRPAISSAPIRLQPEEKKTRILPPSSSTSLPDDYPAPQAVPAKEPQKPEKAEFKNSLVLAHSGTEISKIQDQTEKSEEEEVEGGEEEEEEEEEEIDEGVTDEGSQNTQQPGATKNQKKRMSKKKNKLKRQQQQQQQQEQQQKQKSTIKSAAQWFEVDEREAVADWVPPANQSGDGKTNLNQKLGY